MREKKFRIWDKNNKVFLEDYYTNKFLIDLDGKPFKISNSVIEQIKGVELMQYTGLKDIAGNEIYEGDIVRDVSDGIVGYIEYSDGSYVIVYDDITEKLNADESAYLEVVGNIYDNPELLGEEV